MGNLIPESPQTVAGADEFDADTPLAVVVIDTGAADHVGVIVCYGGVDPPETPVYRFTVENNTISEEVSFSHGAGAAVNIVRNNRVTGEIGLKMGPGATNTVPDNTVTGLPSPATSLSAASWTVAEATTTDARMRSSRTTG